MEKEALVKLSVKELDVICKEHGLPRYNHKKHLTKEELINNLLGTVKEDQPAIQQNVPEDKKNYVMDAEAGTLIAFKDKKGYVRSGMVNVNNKNTGSLEVSLKSGRKFYITYNDVLWVTSEENHRWPKEILCLLKESQKAIEEDFRRRTNITENDVAFLKKRLNGVRS